MSVNKIISKGYPIFFKLFNTRAAGIYILLFATAIGIATFVENDFGTSSAQKIIFKSWWFELLLLLFSISLIFNIFKFRMIPQKKWSLLMFHSAMIIILIGAGVTRYFGFEGMMHIREGEASNTFLSAETYLKYQVRKNGKNYTFDEPVLFATLGDNTEHYSYQIGNDLIEVDILDFIPNPKQTLSEDENGKPILKIVIGGMNGREEYYISPGDKKNIRNIRFNFTDVFIPSAINLKYENGSLFIKSNAVLTQTVMATQTKDTLFPKEEYYPLRLRSLYSDGPNNFVFGDFQEKASLSLVSEGPKVKSESLTGLMAEVSINGEKETSYIFGKKGLPGKPTVFNLGGLDMAIAYGAKDIFLPFSIKLYDFIMEKYPGTNSAASYASEVQLIDNRKNLKKDYRIYMNNILTHDGYRFFQSSFDQDEQGTYLSVNHDFWGTWISYLGYALLTIGMLMVFVSKKTRFHQVRQKLKKSQSAWSIVLLMMVSTSSFGQKVIKLEKKVVDEDHAALFSHVVVQDHKGRMKPIHTLTREILRKMSRKETIDGFNADQVILSMYADKQSWVDVPLIKTSKNPKILELLNVQENDLATFADFFEVNGGYKLRDEVRRAYSLQPIDRGTFEKDLMKIDERVNIASMVYSGRFFKLIPIVGSDNNEWAGPDYNHTDQSRSLPVADKFFTTYPAALNEAILTSDYSFVNQVIQELMNYQQKNGGEVMPSNAKINFEIALNKMNVFSRLSLYYSIIGLLFLILLFISVFRPQTNFSKIGKLLFYLAVAGFVFHTLGLGIRWYVSGRAPWSNGYESLIYIGWTTTLAGLIFTRKSLGGLAATMILAGTILLVAMLSYLDPEITPLVPVLKSYWLTIHVSLIAGSYGFLMLGAIIGLINLILMVFLNNQNISRIREIVREMSYISELTLVGGLVMISIGTYLGGVWANESWGRYWGWDAKETWALVTILVYAFILHMRIIPKAFSLYSYNLATLFGWASVVMTYFGVNYYLSGLHSYAAGDPIPIPTWVYISVASFFIISVLAFWRKKKVDF